MFLCARPFLTPQTTLFDEPLGGTEQCVLHLAQALASRGHRVHVVGATRTPHRRGNVHFLPAGPPPNATIAVAINDARLLNGTSGAPCVWLHNEVAFWKEARRARLLPLWQHRPTAILLSRSQARQASRLLPFARRVIIRHGLTETALAATRRAAPPAPRALFISQAYRGLAWLIALWRTRIAPACPEARFDAYVAEADLEPARALAANHAAIRILPRISNADMPATLGEARLLLAPGHAAETFCLAAAESIAAGVPVLTRGIGALRDRVHHGHTGFIANSCDDFAAHTITLLTNDALWRRMHQTCLANSTGQDWHSVAHLWENLAHELGA